MSSVLDLRNADGHVAGDWESSQYWRCGLGDYSCSSNIEALILQRRDITGKEERVLWEQLRGGTGAAWEAVRMIGVAMKSRLSRGKKKKHRENRISRRVC